jgi:DMSO/TMAO reductase YedYZ heme-binding membrane subunit
MNAELAWHVARASGLVAWGLAALSVLGGFALSGRALPRRRVPPAWLTAVHRSTGGLAVVFTAVHVAALVLDDYVSFSLVDVLVPFASSWRPGAVAWGVVALYLLVAVELSSLLRRRLPTAWWRRLHMLSVPLFAAGSVHQASAGTDAGHPLAQAAVLLTAVAFIVLGSFRVLSRPPRRRVQRARRSSQRATATPVAGTR